MQGPTDLSRATSGAAAPETGAWRDLRVRLISAGVLAPLGVCGLVNGGWVFTVLVLLTMLGLGLEWTGLVRARHPNRGGVAANAMLLLWPALCLLVGAGVDWLAGLRLLLGGLLLGDFSGGGIVLIGLGGMSLVWLRGMTGIGIASLLFVVLVVWASDSLAYLVGRAVGGAKLAPRISPGKTRAGALGGLCGAMVAGALVAGLTPAGGLPGRVLRGALLGGLLGIAAQSGDLAESALKRRCGVKDSGRLIPGHGGLLDRLDGLLSAAPLAALLSLGCAPGQPFWQLDPTRPGRLDIGARHLQPGWLEGVLGASALRESPH